MENKIKFLIIPLVIIVLFIPNFASADIFGIMDLFESQLGAIEEFTGVPMSLWVKTFIRYVIGLITFTASGSLLNWVIKLPLTNPEIVSLSNPFVTQGWAFTAGLVNMGIILILLMIAFAYILKIETFAAKQTFVKLIIVALLINFSLVFVKALFDISTILYNYILNLVGQNFVVESFKTFTGGLWGVIIAMMGSILVLTAPLMIPPAAPWVQFGILIAWLTGGYFFIPAWLFQMAIAFLFSFIFFLLFFLFSARIFIIWILAVLAPLAFVCWVLPQTKKFWDQWLKWLLDWMFFGMVILFLLALGLKAIPLIERPWFVWVGGILPVPGYVYYYFFLFVYLLVVVYLLRKKFMPEFAEFLIEQSKAVGGMIWTRGLRPMAGIAARGAAEIAARQKEMEEAAERGERKPLTFWEKTPRVVTAPTRWAYRAIGLTPEEIMKKRLEEEEKEAKEIRDPELLLSKAGWAMRAGDFARAAQIISTGIEKGKEFKKRIEEAVTEADAIRMGLEANRMKLTDQAERIGRTFVNVADRMGFAPITSEDTAKGYRDIKDKLIGEAKGDQIKDFAKNFWKSPESMEAIQKFWGGPQLGRAADEFGRLFVDDYTKAVREKEEREPGWFTINNPKTPRYIRHTPAQDLGYDPSVFRVPPTGWIRPDGTTGGPPPKWRPGNPIPPGWKHPPSPPTPPAGPAAAEREERLAPEELATEATLGALAEIKEEAKRKERQQIEERLRETRRRHGRR